MEEFKAGVKPRVKVHLCERQVARLDEAARMAEAFSLITRPGYSGGQDELGRLEARAEAPRVLEVKESLLFCL